MPPTLTFTVTTTGFQVFNTVYLILYISTDWARGAASKRPEWPAIIMTYNTEELSLLLGQPNYIELN